MQVLVSGCYPEYVKNTLTPKLREWGVDVIHHWAWNHKRACDLSLPQGTEGVILIITNADENLIEPTRKLAREAGIPWTSIGRQFTRALPALQRCGIVTRTTPIQIKEAAPTPEPEEKKMEHTMSESQIKSAAFDWAILCIEHKPERTDKEIVQLIKDEKEINGFTEADLLGFVQTARRDLHETWSDPKGMLQADRMEHGKRKMDFAVRYCVGVLRETGKLPAARNIQDEIRKYCGTGVSNNFVTSIRNKSFAKANDNTPEETTPEETTPEDNDGRIPELVMQITSLKKERDEIQRRHDIRGQTVKEKTDQILDLEATISSQSNELLALRRKVRLSGQVGQHRGEYFDGKFGSQNKMLDDLDDELVAAKRELKAAQITIRQQAIDHKKAVAAMNERLAELTKRPTVEDNTPTVAIDLTGITPAGCKVNFTMDGSITPADLATLGRKFTVTFN